MSIDSSADKVDWTMVPNGRDISMPAGPVSGVKGLARGVVGTALEPVAEPRNVTVAEGDSV